MLDRPTHREQSEWTAERIETLKKMWAEGLSASQIAAALGGVTRNAVVGKVWRLKLGKRLSLSPMARHHVPYEKKPRAPRPPRPKKPKVLKIGAVHKPLKVEPVTFTAAVWEPLPGAVPVSMADLGRYDCRWPIGDPLEPGFGFCGCAAMEGRPYCAEHYARSIGKGTASEQRAVDDARKIAA